MLPSKLDDINEAFLQSVCDEGREESSKLDFKQKLPGTDDKDKKEFAKDVCAMANAEGGDIVYGIVEKRGAASHLKALSFEEESPDIAKQRLINIMGSWLEPHLDGVQFEAVHLKSGYVFLVRVPQSPIGPHCVRDRGKKRVFVKREGVLTRHLDYEELRRAFSQSNTLQKEALNFRTKRLEKIKKGEVWGPLSEGPYCVLHWIPISTKALFDSYSIRDVDFSKFIRMKGGAQGIPNQEGIRYHYVEEDKVVDGRNGIWRRLFWNAQIFRSGALEMAFALSFFPCTKDEKKWMFPHPLIEDLRGAMDGFKNGMSSVGYTGRMIVGVSILFAEKCGFMNEHKISITLPYSEGEDIILEEETVDNFQEVSDIVEIELPILNVLFQSFGLQGAPYYDESGKRIRLF
ncbi:MAG: ATP-binding protein [Hyphomicrobiales bacterium]|nr:ATP-binding protein [Hyphomicrobiales bacterium]